jgi:hypothetical protein
LAQARDLQNSGTYPDPGHPRSGRKLPEELAWCPQCGVQLVAIVEAFGNVANSLPEIPPSKNDEGSPPKQATRIEPYDRLIFLRRLNDFTTKHCAIQYSLRIFAARVGAGTWFHDFT